jgi:N-acetylglucosaminyldiphosphoundecaprenol N-acetyl-beta-D-mannosaminyltransferase
MDAALHILRVPVHNVTYPETLNLIAQFIGEGGPHQICTVNPEFVMTAQNDPEFMEILQRADLCVPDGVGLLWAARWLRQPLRERVAGSDLVPLLAREAATKGWRIFFLGAAEGVAERAAGILKDRNPSLKVAGTWSGSPRPEDDEEAVARIVAAAPQILLVAYGAPAQDKWIARNRMRLNVSVLIGVGGAFDFITGNAPRAPRWVQGLGLEWLHRLIKQPWRWQRIATAVPKFTWAVLRKHPHRS